MKINFTIRIKKVNKIDITKEWDDNKQFRKSTAKMSEDFCKSIKDELKARGIETEIDYYLDYGK